MDYLEKNIMDIDLKQINSIPYDLKENECQYWDVYEFIFDRTR